MSSNDILTYFDLVRQMKNPFDLRIKMVMYAKKYGNKPCARVFSTIVKTVRKWRRRYEEKGLSGLKEVASGDHIRQPLK